MKNPYNILNPIGVPGSRVQALPLNYAFDLNMDTWWSAVQRARLYSDFTGLDALYSYAMKSSTLIRSAVDKRLRPLRSRTFGVYKGEKEVRRLTKKLSQEAVFRELVYQKGLSNFTFVRVLGVDKDKETFVYPMRNLDIVNRAVRRQTYDVQDVIPVRSHVNLFWLQTAYQSEDTLGLLEPICRDYINMVNAQNNWQTASNILAFGQLMMYYENGDKEMEAAANEAAKNVGLGKVIVSGKVTNELDGKVTKELELDNVFPGTSADTFRIFKENVEQLRGSIMQLVLGSSLLGMSEKNTNSERLVRAHLKLFRDICESDAIEVQDWLNKRENIEKLAYLFDEPELLECRFEAKPSSYIDIGDVETYVKMVKELNMIPTGSFVEKTGLDKGDVIGYEDTEDTGGGSAAVGKLRGKRDAEGNRGGVVASLARRLFKKTRPVDGQGVAGQARVDP